MGVGDGTEKNIANLPCQLNWLFSKLISKAMRWFQAVLVKLKLKLAPRLLLATVHWHILLTKSLKSQEVERIF